MRSARRNARPGRKRGVDSRCGSLGIVRDDVRALEFVHAVGTAVELPRLLTARDLPLTNGPVGPRGNKQVAVWRERQVAETVQIATLARVLQIQLLLELPRCFSLLNVPDMHNAVEGALEVGGDHGSADRQQLTIG